MGVVDKALQWYKLHWGRGRAMRKNGATVRSCPHCERETPVFQTEYDSAGRPLSFSVCVWCDGYIEYDEATANPHEPYATAKERQTGPMSQ